MLRIIASWQAASGLPNILAVRIAGYPIPRRESITPTNIPAALLARFAGARSTRGRVRTNFSTGRSIRRVRPSSGNGGARPARADGWRRNRCDHGAGTTPETSRLTYNDTQVGGGFSWTFAPSITVEASYATPPKFAVTTQRHYDIYARLTFRPLLMFPKVAAAQ